MKGFILKFLDGINVAFVTAQHTTWLSVFAKNPFDRKKALLVFVFYLAANLKVHSQSTFNLRDRYDFLSCVLSSVHPTDSCYYVTGIVADTLEPYNTGALLMKIDLQGNPLFIKTIKSTNKTYETWFKDLVPDSGNGFYTVGITFDSILKTLLIKWDTNGDTIFTTEYINPFYPSSSFITPNGGMRMLPNKNLAIFNWVGNPDIFNADYYLIIVDSLGKILNSRIWGTTKYERPESLVVTAGGEIILGGIKNNTNTNTQNYTYQCDITMVDSLGNVVWNYLSPTSIGLRDAANDIVALDDGSIVVASGVGHEIDESSVNDVFFDRHVYKLNYQHQLEWELTFPDSVPTYWTRTTNLIALKNSTGYILGGVHYLPEIFPPYDQPIKGWFAKISDDGDSIWSRRYSYVLNEVYVNEILDMKETIDGGLIVCGQSVDYQDNAIYPQQGWLLKLDKHGCLVPGCHLTDDTEESILQAASINIYPNPTSDYLNFYIHAPNRVNDDATIRIIDSNGRLVNEFKANDLSSTFILPVWEWANGAYWVQVIADGELVSTEKFLKIGK